MRVLDFFKQRISILYVAIIVVVIFIILFLNNIEIASTGDFVSQTLSMTEFFKQNLIASGDIFPQLNMNGGLGQSFVTTFYYGFFDPFVRMYYFWSGSFLSYKQFIMITQIILSMLIMYEILKDYDWKYKITGTLLVGFSGYFLRTQSYYFIFSNSFLYFLLMVLGIKKMFEGKSSFFYILGWSLLISINLPGAFAVMMFLGLYVLLLVTEKNYDKEKILKVFKRFLVATIIGMLLTAFIWIPQVEYLLMGSREQSVQNIPFITSVKESFNYITSQRIFLYELTYMTIFLYILKPNKKHLLIFIIFIILFISPWFIYFANGFQKINSKGYIYAIVPYTIWMLQLLKNKEIKLEHIIYSLFLSLITYYNLILGILSLLVVLASLRYKINKIYPIIYILIIANLLIILNLNVKLIFIYRLITLYAIISMIILIKFKKGNFLYYIIIPFFITSSILGNMKSETQLKSEKFSENIKEYNKIIEYQKDKKLDMYRDSYIIDNIKRSMIFNLQTNLSNPNYYTSIVNPYLIDSLSNYTDFQKVNHNDFHIKFANSYVLENQFSFGNQSENNIVKKPIFYGTNTLFNSDYIKSVNKSTNLLYFFNGTYVEDSLNSPNLDLDKYKLVGDQTIEVNTTKESINLQNLNKGELIISAKIDESEEFITNNPIILNVNGQLNKTMYFQGILRNEQLTWYLPITEPNSNIKYSSNLDGINLKDLNIYYIPLDQLAKIEEDIIMPYNFSYDLNNSYSFEVDMPKQGYISTTLPFDKGYKVEVNGEEVEAEIVNKSYLGFKVPKGNSKIKINYKIHNIGIYLSISLLALVYMIYKGVRRCYQ